MITFSPGGKALGHDPVGPLSSLGDDRPLGRAVAGTDDEQSGIALRVASHRLLRHEESRCVDRLRELGGHEHAGEEQRLRGWRSGRGA